jgi:hypothetical protein
MFKLNPTPTFTVPVPLTVPGLPEPLEVNITFRHKTRAALRAWVDAGRGKDEVALLHELIEGWSGVFDDAGAPVPYSLTALNDLVGSYWAAQEEISDAYLRELKESKTKNSVRLRAA